ncbi:MAG: hypothetical protein KBS52_02410 [Clostridiales bacterium]|nr:hypothetical protein [Candidatus Equinaster intestinalis]
MKKGIKNISKKVISLLVAVALVVSCITVTFSVFAAGNLFSVPASSPAIPLYVNKAIDLQNLSIEVGGTFQTGDSLDWTLVSGNSAAIKSGFLAGTRTGVTKFSVSDGTDTQNVYAIVNARGNSDFYIAGVDFNEDGYNPDEWISGIATLSAETAFAGNGWNNGTNTYGVYSTGKYKIADVGVTTAQVKVGGETKTALKIPASTTRFANTAAFYKNDYLDDFADIDFNANLSYVGTDSNYISPFSAVGMFSRVKLNKEAEKDGDMILAQTKDKSYAFRIRNYGGLLYNSINGIDDRYTTGIWETTTLAGGQATEWYTKAENGGAYGLTQSALCPGTNLNPDYVLTPEAPTTEYYKNRNVDFQLSGKFVKYSLDGNVIFDSSKKMSRFSLDFAMNKAPFAVTDGTDLNPNTNWDNNINCYGGGTIAFNNTNAADNNNGSYVAFDNSDLYVYSFTVAPLNIKNAEALPEMTDVGEGETEKNIPINSRMSLSQIDSDVVWDDARTENYEVKNGTLMAYSGVGTTITLTGKKNQADFLAEVKIIEQGGYTDYTAKAFADDKMTIVPVLTSNTDYQVKIARNWGALYGSLTVTANGTTEKLLKDIGDGRTYAFSTALADKMILAAQYTSYEKAVKSIEAVQAWVREGDEQKQTTDAIRFQTKIPALVWDGVSVNPKYAHLCTDILEIDGKEVTIENIGALVIPSVLLGQADLIVEDSQLNSFNPATDTRLLVNGNYAANVPITKLSTATETYSEAFATIGNLTTTKGVDAHDVELTAVSYIQYSDDDGNRGYIYSKPIADSYNHVLENAYKFDESSSTLDTMFPTTGIGTDHDLDSSNDTTNISYGLNENISFICEVKGNYRIDWELYKDNPQVNSIAELGEKVVSPNHSAKTNTPVLTGSGMHKVTVTTKMKEAGTVKLICSIKTANGRQVMYSGGNATVIISAAADYANIKSPLEYADNKPTSFINKKGQTVNMTTDEFIDSMRTEFDKRVSVVGSRMDAEKSEITKFINSAAQGDTYTIDKTMKLYCAVANGTYRYFDFIFSVNDTVGLTTTDSTRLFKDACFATAASETGLPQYNLRPATGCMAIPYNSSGMTKFKSFYIGYGGHAGNRSGGTAGTFYLMTNAHGYDNTLYYTNGVFSVLQGSSVNNGGISNCILGSDEAGITDPTQVYTYGMLMRDYIALKAGEKLYDYLTNGGAISDFTITGASMGAFQTHFMTALEPQVTYTEGSIPWMTMVGQEKTDYYISALMPTQNTAVYYYSTLNAAEYVVKTLANRPKNYRVKVSGGLSDPWACLSGTLALFNVYKEAPCERWLAISQFQLHGDYPFSWNTGFDHVTQVKNY